MAESGAEPPHSKTLRERRAGGFSKVQDFIERAKASEDFP
jgi:hypothetical protein